MYFYPGSLLEGSRSCIMHHFLFGSVEFGSGDDVDVAMRYCSHSILTSRVDLIHSTINRKRPGG